MQLADTPVRYFYRLTKGALSSIELWMTGDARLSPFRRSGICHIDVARALSEEVSENLRCALEALTVLGQLNSTERVAHFLVELHELYTSRQMASAPLTLPLTRQDIADYLGVRL